VGGLPVWTANNAVPPGTMIDWPSETPPDWALVMDGAEYDRGDYAELFAVIGTLYGVGDGSTTFNVPDQRGRFRRGVPTGGTVGTYQNDAFKAHTHLVVQNFEGNIHHTYPGSFESWNYPRKDAENNYGPLYTGSTGDSETLPKNIHMLPVIAY